MMRRSPTKSGFFGHVLRPVQTGGAGAMSATAYSCGRARLVFLLGGTAAIALLAGKPADAISINDPVAAAAGGIANYYV